MFIKQISIQGFKSYKDQVVTEPFSRKHNVVVGRNGSGKSNFFAAIRFVLGDAYTSLGREERQALLHEGSGPSAVNAFVEIVFDNADHRFPTGRDSVILRRTIGLKKDEYQLDRKSVPKSEVTSLLESAGFSRSNPYFIVPQGRVTSLCNSKDAERLHLLKEVAGTRVYEQRRQDSLKIMEETETKRTKINELLVYIEERLGELEEEKEELRKFYEIDKSKRSAEYTLYTKELKDVNDEIEQLEEKRREASQVLANNRLAMEERASQIVTMTEQLDSLGKSIDSQTLIQRQLKEEIEDIVRMKAKAELSISDLSKESDSFSADQRKFKQSLESFEKELLLKEKALRAASEELESLTSEESKLKFIFEEHNQKRLHLENKQGICSRYSSKQDRDHFIRSEIDSTIEKRSGLNELRVEIEKEIRDLKEKSTSLDSELQKLGSKASSVKERANEIKIQLSVKKHDKEELVMKQKDLWRQESLSVSKISLLKDSLRKAQKSLHNSMDKGTASGLEAIKRIVQRENIPGVFGPVYELFSVEGTFSMAVDVTAGHSLYHVVVDTDDTAERVLRVLNQEKSGRVTFMPLNRLSTKEINYPSDSRVIPLISKLQFDQNMYPALFQIFGKTCLCSDLEVAANLSRSHNLNGITLDGDRAERKGAITGGYHDRTKNRISNIRAWKQMRGDIEGEERALDALRLQINDNEKQLIALSNEISGMEIEYRRNQDFMAQLESAIDSQTNISKISRQRLESLQKNLDSTLASDNELSSQLHSLEEQLKSPWVKKLSDEEEKELGVLMNKTSKLRFDIHGLSVKRGDLESEKGRLAIEIESLLRKKRKVEERWHDRDLDALKNSLDRKETEQKSAESSLKSREKHLKETEKALIDAQKKQDDLKRLIEKFKQESEEENSSVEKFRKYLEKCVSWKSVLSQKKDDVTNKIKHLGAMPEDAFEKYSNWSSSKLAKEIHDMNEQLSKFSNVNKKAFEQFNNFTTQRSSLLERKDELDTSAASIRELIDVLDQRKNDAIKKTFLSVSSNFSEMFEKIVPAGFGSLIMLGQQGEIVPSEDSGSLDDYVGIAIKVSFNSKTDEGLMMQQLSGGQKSVVALALIFAIQKCDPAPFYLFDEIDANLDAAYRSSVATLINELSADAQFITTTFRPEMLQHADKFYGVSFRDRVSRIDVISKDEALGFVEQEVRNDF